VPIGISKLQVQLTREIEMIRRTLLAAGIAVLVATPALAFHCPKDVKAIDAAMTKMGAKAPANVKALRDEGDALHKAGKHKEAVGKLSEAMRVLLGAM
jgi:hypothetical protein